MKWIETRDNLPPSSMQVLFYVRDEIEGYTEDFVCQGCVWEIKDAGTISEKVRYMLQGGVDVPENHTVSHWTLLPPSPTPWRL